MCLTKLTKNTGCNVASGLLTSNLKDTKILFLIPSPTLGLHKWVRITGGSCPELGVRPSWALRGHLTLNSSSFSAGCKRRYTQITNWMYITFPKPAHWLMRQNSISQPGPPIDSHVMSAQQSNLLSARHLAVFLSSRKMR